MGVAIDARNGRADGDESTARDLRKMTSMVPTGSSLPNLERIGEVLLLESPRLSGKPYSRIRTEDLPG